MEKASSNIYRTDWLTVIALAVIGSCLTVTLHEGVHAATCLILGGQLHELSALHVECSPAVELHSRVVSGSASLVNLMLGILLLLRLRQSQNSPDLWRFFLWLFMLMNWFNAAGYWMFSGIGNIGDWANVIRGWEPHWLWRVILAAGGTSLYLYFVWLALHELGKLVGGEGDKPIKRAIRLGILAYVASVVTIGLAAAMNAEGLTGLPAVAGILAVAGGSSPLLWMMQWFRADYFPKLAHDSLSFTRNWQVIGGAVVIAAFYIFVLGPSIIF